MSADKGPIRRAVEIAREEAERCRTEANRAEQRQSSEQSYIAGFWDAKAQQSDFIAGLIELEFSL
jgi:hypothetical protein